MTTPFHIPIDWEQRNRTLKGENPPERYAPIPLYAPPPPLLPPEKVEAETEPPRVIEMDI